MTRRERLMRTLRGQAVDRPAVSFYEIGALKYDPDDPDIYNVHNDPSWRPLLELAEEKTDIIRRADARPSWISPEARREFFRTEIWEEGRSRFIRTIVKVGGKTLTTLSRRDAEIDTGWQLEHLLKNEDDLKAYMQLPDEALQYERDYSAVEETERALGDCGIALIDTGDPLCVAAELFSMADYTIIAMTEPALFHALLTKCARYIQPTVEKLSRQCPGRIWRICGPEYATEPYLPPRLFEEYVVRYTRPMVEAIQAHGGYARIHCHGRLRNILPHIQAMGADGLDPIEPAPQGDVTLAEVRRQYGRDMVLLGNIEAADIENLDAAAFEKKVVTALGEGTAGTGRGFVLMPSASPYGRTITARTMTNYETMIRLAENWAG